MVKENKLNLKHFLGFTIKILLKPEKVFNTNNLDTKEELSLQNLNLVFLKEFEALNIIKNLQI